MVFLERRPRPLLDTAVQGYVKWPSWNTTVIGYVNISTPGCRIWPFFKLWQSARSAAWFHHPWTTPTCKYINDGTTFGYIITNNKYFECNRTLFEITEIKIQENYIFQGVDRPLGVNQCLGVAPKMLGTAFIYMLTLQS